MRSATGTTESIWMEAGPLRTPPPLDRDLRTDICIIGAGIAGITIAYRLAAAGRRVVVLEDGAIGGGETGRTTAHLSDALDDRYQVLERHHGRDGARIAAESHGAAIDFIEETVAREAIDCGFERLDGYLFVPPGESTDLLDDELEAARRAGLAGVERVARAPLPAFDTGPALRFPRQGQFQPLAYVGALADKVERLDGRILGAHVTEMDAGPPARIATRSGPTVTADIVICATNAPVIDWLVIHSKQAAYRTFAIAVRLAAAVPTALYWDTADPYHYVRRHGDLLIVGGEDHKTGQADDAAERFARLEAWTRDRFPVGRTEARWSGQVMEPVDGLGYIGRNPGKTDHVFVATGDSGHGMTHGTIAGLLIGDRILGRARPEWETLYDPSRKSLRSAAEYVKENVNVARQYVDLVTPGELHSEDEVRPGEGAVVRHGARKLAVYRDDSGRLHRLSAICTHLGCVVHWNSLERSWDCPCHGSRFGIDGRVLNGPAAKELERVEPDGR